MPDKIKPVHFGRDDAGVAGGGLKLRKAGHWLAAFRSKQAPCFSCKGWVRAQT
jgi:hypothetical protein